MRRSWGRVVTVLALVLLLAPVAAVAAPSAPGRPAGRVQAVGIAGDPNEHLAEILAVSDPPTYRRYGSAGMAAAADVAAGVLERAGLDVLRHDVPGTVWNVDYSPGHEPSLVRLTDGQSFRTESGFNLGAVTDPAGLSCTVRMWDQVQAGECGFVPVDMVSPEWNNFGANVPAAVRTIVGRGGVGAILQGDVDHDALIAIKVNQPIPVVTSLVRPVDVLGQSVRLRAMGASVPATMHNVVAVQPPSDPTQGYVLLQAHLDGWFTAAADNAAGAGAVLAAAERLAGDVGGRGLIVALYDAEEWGLVGSKAFAADLARPEGLRFGTCGPVVHLNDVVAVVNLDVPSAIASDVFSAVQSVIAQPVPLVSYRVLVFSEEPALAALLLGASSLHGVLGLPAPVAIANPFNGGANRTDIKWFHDAGIPAAWPVVGYPEYHTEADTILTVDPADLAQVTAATVDLVRLIDLAPIGRLDGSALAAPGTVDPVPLPATCGAAAAGQPAVTMDVEGAQGALPATGGAGAPGWSVVAVPLALVLLVLRRRLAFAT